MMKNIFSDLFITNDRQKIFFQTNFDFSKLNLKKDRFKNKNLLIFNYGLVCSHIHWRKQIAFFDQLDYPILIHDYRGHFKSTAKSNLEDVNFTQMSNDLFHLIQFLNIKNPVTILGHSMGVNVTLEFAKLYPFLVKQLILVSGTALSPSYTMFNSNIMSYLVPLLEHINNKFPQIVKTAWKSSAYNPFLRELVMFGGFNREVTSMNFIKVYLKNMSRLPVELFLKLFSEMGQHDILPYLRTINAPTLLISGDNDKMIPNFTQQVLLKNLPHAKIFVVKDAGHVPQIDFPDIVNERIFQFINEKF